jgi:hypothetical protein
MSNLTYRSSRPDGWTVPRAYSDASLRYRSHGPVLPMREDSWLERVLDRMLRRR